MTRRKFHIDPVRLVGLKTHDIFPAPFHSNSYFEFRRIDLRLQVEAGDLVLRSCPIGVYRQHHRDIDAENRQSIFKKKPVFKDPQAKQGRKQLGTISVPFDGVIARLDIESHCWITHNIDHSRNTDTVMCLIPLADVIAADVMSKKEMDSFLFEVRSPINGRVEQEVTDSGTTNVKIVDEFQECQFQFDHASLSVSSGDYIREGSVIGEAIPPGAKSKVRKARKKNAADVKKAELANLETKISNQEEQLESIAKLVSMKKGSLSEIEGTILEKEGLLSKTDADLTEKISSFETLESMNVKEQNRQNDLSAIANSLELEATIKRLGSLIEQEEKPDPSIIPAIRKLYKDVGKILSTSLGIDVADSGPTSDSFDKLDQIESLHAYLATKENSINERQDWSDERKQQAILDLTSSVEIKTGALNDEELSDDYIG